MVKHFYLLFFLFLTPFSFVFSQEVKVTAQIDQEGIVGQSLKGTITVTHRRKDPVKVETFRLGDEDLSVELVKVVELSPLSDFVISIYSFSIEAESAGLHFLDEVKVQVGKKEWFSIPTSYVVREEAEAPPPSPPPQRGTRSKPPQAREQVILELENIIEGDTTLYPGQQLIVGYRFLYNFSFDLTTEELPLLQAGGFEKVGGKETKEFKIGQLNHLEARQTIEAVQPGSFSFAGGVVEGRAYQMDQFGRKSVAPLENRAESPPVTIDVRPFPEKDQPPAFNGAIGTDLSFDVTLLSSDTLAAQDKMTLLIKISGKGQLSTLPLPELCCQPEMSGFFRLSDLPPEQEIIGNTKTFRVEMRPIAAFVKYIPSFSFSYFNPQTKTYETLKSEPIPIEVSPLKQKVTEDRQKQTGQKVEEEEETVIKPGAIEIDANYPLSATDLEPKLFGRWWVLLILPFGIAFLFLQLHVKKYLQQQKERVPAKTSKDLFHEALTYDRESGEFFHFMQRAFLLRLFERGDIVNTSFSPDYLPHEGAPGRVRELFQEIQEIRFAGGGHHISEEMLLKIKRLFDEIKP